MEPPAASLPVTAWATGFDKVWGQKGTETGWNVCGRGWWVSLFYKKLPVIHSVPPHRCLFCDSAWIFQESKLKTELQDSVVTSQTPKHHQVVFILWLIGSSSWQFHWVQPLFWTDMSLQSVQGFKVEGMSEHHSDSLGWKLYYSVCGMTNSWKEQRRICSKSLQQREGTTCFLVPHPWGDVSHSCFWPDGCCAVSKKEKLIHCRIIVTATILIRKMPEGHYWLQMLGFLY